MSHSHTPVSVSSSSTGSRSSYRRLDSDTTPSPSGGDGSPVFNPRILSNKLAMIEASQALAQASATLSIAAQAMSRAAASLATVGDYSEEDYAFGVEGLGGSKDWAGSPDWSQSSYNLSSVSKAVPNDYEMHVVDEGYKLSKPVELTTVEDKSQECTNESRPPGDVAAIPQVETQLPTTHTNVPQASSAASSGQHSHCAPSSTVSSGSTLPSTPSKPATHSQVDNKIATEMEPSVGASKTLSTSLSPAPAPASTVVPQPASGTTALTKDASESFRNASYVPKNYHGTGQPPSTNTDPKQSQAVPVGAMASSGPTRIILESGFDLLPSLCHLTKRCAKSVCLYNYSGLTATISVAAMLRANTKLPVMIPASTRQEKLAAAVNKFNSAQSGILLWPGCITLLKVTELANSPDIQLIQLGRPIQTGAATAYSTTTLVLAKSDLVQPQDPLTERYSVDTLEQICNQQGVKSPLQPFRLWLRSRLSDDSYARGFYWDWFLQYRRGNPKQSVVDALKLANQYAEEFLLRGESKKYGEPVGGKVPLTEGTVMNQKLGAAVQMGVLLVA